MVFWQLTIDANDPVLLARFWAQALGYQPAPPTEPETTWHTHYRARLGGEASFADRLFDPAGLRPPIWFQQVPEGKPGEPRTGRPRMTLGRTFDHDSRNRWIVNSTFTLRRGGSA